MTFDAVRLPDGMDFVMRPVLRGLCKYESLKDGTLDLCDIADMNDAISAMDENAHRASEAARLAAKR